MPRACLRPEERLEDVEAKTDQREPLVLLPEHDVQHGAEKDDAPAVITSPRMFVLSSHGLFATLTMLWAVLPGTTSPSLRIIPWPAT